MKAGRRPTLIGVSGVDGSGKSSLVRSLVQHYRGAGDDPGRLYLYGCLVCRRWGRRSLSSASGNEHGVSRRAMSLIQSLHAHLDAGEMSARLAVAVLPNLWRQGPRLIITDRSPLDGLVKHDPPPSSLVARWYVGIAQRYSTLLWLDGEAATLAARDGEHTEQQLAAAQNGFRKWSTRLPNVVRIDTTGTPLSEITRRVFSAGVS